VQPYPSIYSLTQPYTDIRPYTIIALTEFDTFHSRDLAIYPFRRVATKSRVLSINMPPKKFTRTQLRIADIHDSDDILQTAVSIGERATRAVLPEAEIDDEDDLDDDLGDRGDKVSPIANYIGDLRSQRTDEDRLDVATQNRLMLEMLLENQAQWKAEQKLARERLAAEQERMAAVRDQSAAEPAERTEPSIRGPRPNIYTMVDPVRYCGGSKELDPFLDALRSNFNSHGHLFPPGGPDHVKYANSHLDAWGNHQNPALRQIAMTDPSEWAGDLSAESGPCLQDFDLFSQEIAKVYGDKNQRRVAVITLMQEYIQLPQELVRAYANRVKVHWRQAGWNRQKHEEVLYDIAWAGLRNSLKNNVGPMTPSCGRYDTLDEFFDKAEASEVTHAENTKPQQQEQQQQQQQQKQPTDSSSKGGNRGYRPSISEPADTTGGGKSGQSGTNTHGKSGGGGQSSGFPPPPWVSTEIFEIRCSTGKCLRCGSPNHKASFCPKYSRGGNPPQQHQTLASNRDGGHQIKRQKSFDNQQPKSS